MVQQNTVNICTLGLRLRIDEVGAEAGSIKMRLSFMNTDTVAEVVKIGLIKFCICNKPKVSIVITLLSASIKQISSTVLPRAPCVRGLIGL